MDIQARLQELEGREPQAPKPPPRSSLQFTCTSERDENGRVVKARIHQNVLDKCLELKEQGMDREYIPRYIHRQIFSINDRKKKNCNGQSEKESLDIHHLNAIKEVFKLVSCSPSDRDITCMDAMNRDLKKRKSNKEEMFKLVSCSPSDRDKLWKVCVTSMDAMNRDLKRKKSNKDSAGFTTGPVGPGPRA